METKRIAVLLTCFNRKKLTLSCLGGVFKQDIPNDYQLTVFLVDDGSTDGTAEAVTSQFPEVNLVKGTGKLFWAGGMRLAWQTAIHAGRFDYYWLINDDTILYDSALTELLKADGYALEEYGQSGIYVGSTCDPDTGAYTYGGQKLRREDDYVHDHVFPTGEYQLCDLCNANSLFVAASVTAQLGILSDHYTHALADYDYSLRVKRAGFPVLVLPDYCGECANDHPLESGNRKESFKKRLNYLFNPKGFAYYEFLYYTRTFFPSRYLRTKLTLWIRTFFPGIWDKYKVDGWFEPILKSNKRIQ